MVIDTSAILAWLKEEPERARIIATLEAHSARRLSAVSLLESQIVVRARDVSAREDHHHQRRTDRQGRNHSRASDHRATDGEYQEKRAY